MSNQVMNKIKGGSFLIESTAKEDVFTPEDFNEDQKMMAQAFTDFMDKEVLPHKERFEKKDYALTEELMKKVGELGALGITTPEEYDGLDMDFNTSMMATDRLSGVTGSFSTAYGAHTGIGTLPVLLYGSEDIKKKYLPGLSNGQLMASYCLTEPDAGSDANSGKTKAVLTADGEHYEITGQKMWISNAGFADIFIVFARIEDDKNITGFIVEKGAEGMTLGDEENKLGIHASSTRQVFFDKVKVSKDAILGERNGGFKIAVNVLNAGRIKLGAGALDSARRIIDLSVKYANERKQFKTPIAKFEAIKNKIAEMSIYLYAAESASYRTSGDITNEIAKLKAEGKSDSEAKLGGLEEFAIECAINKIYGSEMAQHVSDEGIQIYGGMGFSADTPMESAWRDARITRIYEGTNEINRILILSMMLRKGMKGDLDLMGPAMGAMKELMDIPSFEVPDFSEPLSEELDMLSKVKKLGLLLAGKSVQDYGDKLAHKQTLLMNLSEMLIEVYNVESAILRTLKLGDNTTHPEVRRKMCTVMTFEAIEKIATHAKRAAMHIAKDDELKMLLMAIKRQTKFTNHHDIISLKNEIAEEFIKENGFILDYV